MKRLLLAFGIISVACTPNQDLFAQKWTAGLRTGFTQDNLQFNDQFAQGSNLMWHNQAFVDYRFSKKWELELGIGFNQLKNDRTFQDSGEPTAVFFQDWQTKYLTLSLNMKYYFLQKGKWEAFGLAGLGSTKDWSTAHLSHTGVLKPNSMFSNILGESKEETKWLRLSNINAGAGVNYNLSSHLQLSGLFQVSYKADLNNTYYGSSVNQNDFFPVVLIGLGYRI